MSEPKSEAELKKEERDFLHDFANPLATLTLILEAVTELMKEDAPELGECAKRTEQATRLCVRMREMIEARRKVVKG